MRERTMVGSVRRLAMVAVCGAAMATTVGTRPLAAQDAPPPQQGGGPPEGGRRDPAEMQARRLQMMTKQLNLSPDQVTQIKAIDDDQRTQMRALRDDTSTPQADKRAKVMAIRQASTEKTRAVLNDEQKTKFDAMEARHREHGRGDGQGGGDGPPPAPPQQ